ncbi:MAG: hypothetical protein J6M30_03285 [Bacteroidales bacterium]|nr:hypothetical protein [Bacteroidales bacterium]
MNLKIKRFIVRVFDKSIKTGRFFRFMVIMSALYGLCFMLFNAGVLFAKNNITSYIAGNNFPQSFFFYKENLLFFVSANRMLYLICFIAGILILYGCHLLFRGYKWGLLFYTIAKILQIAAPVFFLGHRMIAIGDIMIILLFTVYYYWYAFTHNIDKTERKYNQITDSEDSTTA